LQALQKYRGLDYNTANCNIQELRMPLEPFNKDTNPIIKDHSTAIDAFNYDALNYQYDNLNFHGKTIPELDKYIDEHKDEDRIFANFMLHVSASSKLNRNPFNTSNEHVLHSSI
jgi:hypothetical protein